ncbi:MAG: pyroglutamyl-peptidase I [Deltaproteobacteria bacterium]|nr:pyroglutamyl-peptidase I [Deltaproteobacteria bacterium]
MVVTGFEPFGGLDSNPSSALLPLLPDRIEGHAVERFVLPVDTDRIAGALEALPLERARVVLHLGLALDRRVVSLERVALNIRDFELTDNAGRRVRGDAVVAGGPLALPVRLPYRAILDAWGAAGIPGEPSSSAGTFLCNQCLYLSLARLPAEVRVGFVHVAPDEQIFRARRGPYQPRAVQAEAVRIALEVALLAAEDPR